MKELDKQRMIDLNFLVVTGLSGAGKSKAIEFLEDMGYYCVDNLPPEFILAFYELSSGFDGVSKGRKAAIVSDIRDTEENLKKLLNALDTLNKKHYSYKILFLEAQSEVIVKRYGITRRKHPFIDVDNASVFKAAEAEKSILKPLREISDYIIDTSCISDFQLRARLSELFLEKPKNVLTVNCMSFGFKYGPPSEANLIFDVRCFPNPYYNPELRELTGLDEKIKEYVLEKESTKIFINKLFSLLDFILPLYIKEGKSQLVIAIGCTGGKHRSVAIANLLYNHLISRGYCTGISHRDIQKNSLK